MGPNPWRAGPDGALVLNAGQFQLVVKELGGDIRCLISQRPGNAGAGTHVLFASGTKSDVQAAMETAEKRIASAAGREPSPGRHTS